MTEQESKTADDDLKVVISIRGGIATVGVQRPGTDPHFESFAHMKLEEILPEVIGVYETAEAKWSEQPRYPAHEGATPTPQPAAQPEPDPAEAAQKQATLF